MDCTTAAPFVSMLCDGDPVPEDAGQHIAGCATCRDRLRDWADAGAELRLLAVTERLEPLRPLTPAEAAAPAGPPRWFWRAWLSPVRVPRAAAALVTFALVVSSVGWFRAQTTERVVRELHYVLSYGCMLDGGELKASTNGVQRVGSATRFFTNDSCQTGHRGLLGVIDPVRAHDGLLTLRLGVSVSDATPSTAARVDPAAVHEYEYVPGQVIELPVPGRPPVTFTGALVEREDSSSTRATIDALLPGPNDLVITMPALLRDGHDVVVTMNAGTTSTRGNVAALYAPGAGLFLFGLDRFDGAASALAAGSMLTFEADGHRYTLYSNLPMTAGEQPRGVWVSHLGGYRPSQHGRAVGDDNLPSLGSGTASAYR